MAMLVTNIKDDVMSWELPHETLRPHQEESIRWCLEVQGVGVIQAPTGSGKTSFAAALASQQRVISLVKTKYLQEANYGGGYGFKVLFGKANYPCAHPEVLAEVPRATAEDCIHAEKMSACPYASTCEYLRAKWAAQGSRKASLNYAYYLTAGWPKEQAEALVCDEAHMLSEITLDHAGCTITARQREEWQLPDFPFISARAPVLARVRWELACTWVERAIAALPSAGSTGEDEEDAGEKRLTKLRRKLKATLSALRAVEAGWFFRSSTEGFTARPLTARYHFPRYFLNGQERTLLMSATIGDVETYTKELGITSYAWRSVPSNHPPSTRPVHALPAPRLNARSGELDYAEQAEVIANALKVLPSDWYGLIHVTRKNEAKNLALRLGKLLHNHQRFWTPDPNQGTQDALNWWKDYKRRVPGAIAVAWQFHEGFDGVDEKICISAKVPFPNLGDEYEQERMRYDGAMFLQRTAWQLEQGLGRSRRGNAEDYDSTEERRGYVAIADGNYTRVQKYLSDSLRASIVKG